MKIFNVPNTGNQKKSLPLREPFILIFKTDASLPISHRICLNLDGTITENIATGIIIVTTGYKTIN